jgi:hypothetical protein
MHSIGRLERFQPEKAARQQWRPLALATPKNGRDCVAQARRIASDSSARNRLRPAETLRFLDVSLLRNKMQSATIRK